MTRPLPAPVLRTPHLIAAVVLGCWGGVWGGEELPGDAPSELARLQSLVGMSLEELGEIKVETVYGASRREQKLNRAPSAVTLVTREQIARHGDRTLGEVLQRVRGFYVTSDRSYSYLGIRGFQRPGDFGGRLLVMIDGHRINDAVYDTAAVGLDFPLDIDLIERIEIIRGPGSSLYGNNALFGVINVITRSGRQVDGVEVSGTYGSYDAWSGRTTYGTRFGNGTELLVSGTLQGSEGAERLKFPEFVAEDLDGEQAGNAFMSVVHASWSLRGGYGRRVKDVPTAAWYTLPNSQEPGLSITDQRAFATLGFRHEWGDGWLLDARSSLDWFRFDGIYPYASEDDSSAPPIVNRYLAESFSTGLNLLLGKPLGERHHLSTGVEWRGQMVLDQRNWDDDPYLSHADSNESADRVGIFAQDEWSLRDDLVLSGGLRYDHVTPSGGALTPRVAALYSPWEKTTFKALYGQAFRAPNAYEAFYSGAFFAVNPDLTPKSVRSYELVWEQVLGARWNLTLSAFWNDVDHLIGLEVDPSADPDHLGGGVFRYANQGSARIRGVELEVDHHLPRGVMASASYSFTDTMDADRGAPLPNAPEHLGKVNLSVPVWGNKVFASTAIQAMSGRRSLAGETVSPHAVVNLNLFARELMPGLEVTAGIYNLFDRRYSDPVSSDHYYRGPVSGGIVELDRIQQNGRTFRCKLTYRF
ncbi:MAG: TonB-dependent receptor [Verrucomicrobiae bacterium]|nr:TonB-dependent receptor [Verrucomicrobiae bacterium]